jgi:hypothetical protein
MGLFDAFPSIFKATLGEDVTFSPHVGDPSTIRGIFYSTWEVFAVVDGAQVADVSPAIHISRLDASPAQGDGFTIRGDEYVVRLAQPDACGMSVVLLDRV